MAEGSGAGANVTPRARPASALLFLWRTHRRRSWKATLVVALTIGVVGGIALSSLAGARKTASTFAAYDRDARLSDLAVNTFVPDLNRVAAIGRHAGVASSATYVGLDAYPVLHGKVIRDFRDNGFFGSLDGRFFIQDRATVLDGRLPKLDSTGEIALSPNAADRLQAHVGSKIEYRFEGSGGKPLGNTTYLVVGLVQLPPVIVDENDIIDGAVAPPAATRAHLDALQYAWQGIRLTNGVDGIGAFLDSLRSDPAVNALPLVTQRKDETRVQVQRSIRPQAVALTLFGGAAAIATLALGGLGASGLVKRWSGERLALRAVGLTRLQLALVFALDATIAIAVGIVVASMLTLVLSPLWPVGALREIAPDTGFHADFTVMFGAGGVIALALLAVAAISAARSATLHGDAETRKRPSVVVAVTSRSGVPLPAVLGAHFALDPGDASRSVPVRATLFAGAGATIAVVAALVFGASLHGLVTHPDQYGWAWDRVLIAEAGYGNLSPPTVARLIDREPAVTDWSLLALGTVTVDGTPVPVLGLDRRRGHAEPRVLSGRAVTGDREIALGSSTLDALGKHVGDGVRIAAGGHAVEFTIVGTVTLPSIGQGGADHPSLGRGALVTYDALAEIVAPGASCGATPDAFCPNAIALDLAPAADGDAVVRHIATADPDGVPGGTYEQPVTRAAVIRNYRDMVSFPLALAVLLATAAAVAFLVTLIASVRARRYDLAVLKTLGLTNRQLRATVLAQSLITVLVTFAIGLPLGIVGGRLIWIRFARDLGVVARPTVSPLVLLSIVGAALLSCGLFTVVPAAIAARAPAATTLRTE